MPVVQLRGSSWYQVRSTAEDTEMEGTEVEGTVKEGTRNLVEAGTLDDLTVGMEEANLPAAAEVHNVRKGFQNNS